MGGGGGVSVTDWLVFSERFSRSDSIVPVCWDSVILSWTRSNCVSYVSEVLVSANFAVVVGVGASDCVDSSSCLGWSCTAGEGLDRVDEDAVFKGEDDDKSLDFREGDVGVVGTALVSMATAIISDASFLSKLSCLRALSSSCRADLRRVCMLLVFVSDSC